MQKELATVDHFTTKEVSLLRETYAKDLNDTEFNLFIAQSKAMNLNPFTKEIYGIKLGGRLVLMTSIAGLRKIAHASGRYLGCKITVKDGANGRISSATATVKKLVGSHIAEFEATVMFDEYSSDTGNWKEIPRTMITKTAEAHALRMAFPSLEQLFEQAEVESLVHPETELDVMPAYEAESQEVVINDPGEYVVKFGSRKKNPTKIKDIPKKELVEFMAWVFTQENISDAIKEYADCAEAYLKQTEGN